MRTRAAAVVSEIKRVQTTHEAMAVVVSEIRRVETFTAVALAAVVTIGRAAAAVVTIGRAAAAVVTIGAAAAVVIEARRGMVAGGTTSGTVV